jgi:hypothetical protein
VLLVYYGLRNITLQFVVCIGETVNDFFLFLLIKVPVD